MTILTVVLDSDVIFPLPLRDTLLRAAEKELYRVYWSEQILEDAIRNLINKGRMTEQRAVRLQESLKRYFREAMVEVPQELIERMTNDPGDRHVAAAAVAAKAQVIVTFNLRHFPPRVSEPLGCPSSTSRFFPDKIIRTVSRSFNSDNSTAI
jgi:predicted nucleic acid-binding protein